jgi:hypothetical protein
MQRPTIVTVAASTVAVSGLLMRESRRIREAIADEHTRAEARDDVSRVQKTHRGLRPVR